MPTPMPIMVARMVVNDWSGKTWVRSSTIGSPTARPLSATTMGRAMASTDPKAMSRMMMAATMPISSLEGSGWRSAWVMS